MDPISKQATIKSNTAIKKETMKREEVSTPVSQTEDIKTSLERLRKENKKKFQDPFYLQIDQGDTSLQEGNNLKIVKLKKSEAEEDKRKLSREDLNEDEKKKAKLAAQRKQYSVLKESKEDQQESQHKTRIPTQTKLSNKLEQNKSQTPDQFEKVSFDSVKTIPNLVKLDLNLDYLKSYLDEMQEAVTDHERKLGALQEDIKKKAYEKTISQYFQIVSDSLQRECGERPHAVRLDESRMGEHYLTEDSVLLKKTMDRMGEKFEIIGLNIINLNKHRYQACDRLDLLEEKISKCFTIDMFREESQTQEKRMLKYVNEQLGNFQENLNQQKKELKDGLTYFGKKVDDNEAECLWRIKDCEELLKTRVSDQYVDDSIKSMEEKLHKQLLFSEEKEIERLEKSFKELNQRIQQTNQFFNEKYDDLRKMMRIQDEKLVNMVTLDKIQGIQTGYKDMKYNIERELEIIQDHVRDSKDRIGEVSRRVAILEKETFDSQGQQNIPQNNKQQMSRNMNQEKYISNHSIDPLDASNKSPSGKSKEGGSQLPPPLSLHPPQSSVGSPMMRRKTMLGQQQVQEIDKKIHYFDEQIMFAQQQLQSMAQLIDQKISKEDIQLLLMEKANKEEVIQMVPSEDLLFEKLKYVVRDEVFDIQKELSEQIRSLDQRIVRVRQDTDIHSLAKKLDQKANEQQVKNDFYNHEFKISTLDKNLVKMAYDFEVFQNAINKLHISVVDLQEANRDVLVGKKTINCLSCGKGGDSYLTIKGKDGRMYRGMDSTTNLGRTTGYFGSSNQEGPFGIGGPENLSGWGGNSANINQYISQQLSSGTPGTNDQLHNSSYMEGKQSTKMNHSAIDLGTSSEAGYDASYPFIQKRQGFGFQLKKNTAVYIGHNTSNIVSGQNAVNNQGNSSVMTSHSVSGKRKLPIGFQVQEKKKDLFKIENRRALRGARSQVREYDRPDSAKLVSNNMKTSFAD